MDHPDATTASLISALSQKPSAALGDFVRAWYDEPNLERRSFMRVGANAPTPLMRWYALAEMYNNQLTAQNSFRRPGSLAVEQGMVTFYVENQGVWLWSFLVDDSDDPIVFERENEDHIGWSSTGTPLSQFLVEVAIFEAISGAQHAAVAWEAPLDCVSEVVRDLTPIKMRPWTWPARGHRFYASDRLIALTWDDSNDKSLPPQRTVHVAARDGADLTHVRAVDGIDWDA